MSPNRPAPGSRLFVYIASLFGFYRTAERSLGEAGAPSEEIDPTTRAEPQDVNAKAVFLTGVGLLLLIWAIVVVLYPLFTYFKYERTGGRDPAKVLAYRPPLPPKPRNEPMSPADMDQLRARENAALSGYQWVDRSRGIVSIPISVAMQIVAQRGLPPARPGGEEYYPPSAGTKRTGTRGKVRPLPR